MNSSPTSFQLHSRKTIYLYQGLRSSNRQLPPELVHPRANNVLLEVFLVSCHFSAFGNGVRSSVSFTISSQSENNQAIPGIFWQKESTRGRLSIWQQQWRSLPACTFQSGRTWPLPSLFKSLVTYFWQSEEAFFLKIDQKMCYNPSACRSTVTWFCFDNKNVQCMWTLLKCFYWPLHNRDGIFTCGTLVKAESMSYYNHDTWLN